MLAPLRGEAVAPREGGYTEGDREEEAAEAEVDRERRVAVVDTAPERFVQRFELSAGARTRGLRWPLLRTAAIPCCCPLLLPTAAAHCNCPLLLPAAATTAAIILILTF